MNGHVGAVLIKVVMVAAVLVAVLSLVYDYPVVNTIALSLIVAGVSYVVGDLFILSATNNTIATAADIGLSTLMIWLIGPFIMAAFVPFSVALISSLILGVGEWFFHTYMANSVLEENAERS